MLRISPQECGQVKRRKLNCNEHQPPDRLKIQRRLIGRQESLKVQRRQYAKRWQCVKNDIDCEFDQRQKELGALRVLAHKHFDKIHQSCELKLQTLTSRLQSDIELVKPSEHSIQEMLELANRASQSPTLNILPTVSFKEAKVEIKLSELCIQSLGEIISETPHRCFSSGVVGLVASYLDTPVEFEGKCCLEYQGHGDGAVYSVVGLSGGRVTISYEMDDNNSIYVWDAQSVDQLLEFEGHSGIVNSLAAIDDNRVLSGSRDNTVRLWDLQTGQCIRVFKGHTSSIMSVCVYVDSKGVLRAASGSKDKTICLWDLDTGECLRVLRGHTDYIRSVYATTDGSQRLVSGSDDKTVRVWDTDAGKCLRVLTGHTSIVNSVVVLNNQKRVVSASDDDTLRVWDIETGECLKILKGHTDWIQSVSTFSDGQRIISGSDDKTMRVWNVDTGECLEVVRMDSGVWRVCCLEDGRVISITINDRIQIWE